MKANCNGNTETQKLLRSEIAFLAVVKYCCHKNQFSVCEEIKDGVLREVDITLGKKD